MEEDRFTLQITRKSFTVRISRHWKKVDQITCGCLMPGNVQGHTGCSSEQSGLTGRCLCPIQRGWN